MSDLYRDFSFTRLAVSCSSTATLLTVDDASLLPNNADLAGGDFYLTFDSGLTYSHTFEIVRLISIDGVTLTVQRGVGGSIAKDHDVGTYLKGSVTAAMLERLRHFRTTASLVTPSLAANASFTGAIELAVGYRLYRVQTSQPARVRLYLTTAHRDADLARPVGVDPTGDHGLVFEYLTTITQLSGSLSPLVDGTSLESLPSPQIPITVENRGNAPSVVTTTLTYLTTE